MKKGLILESRVISEITRQRELMGLKPIVLNEATERIPFINKVVKWLVGNTPGAKLADVIGGNAEKAMQSLRDKNINDLAGLYRYLFDDAGVVARNFSGDAEKAIAGAFARKIFSDPNFSELANDTVVEYFERLGKSKDGIDYGQTVKNMLTDDLTNPELKNAADNFIASLERKLQNNQAVEYLKKVVNDPNRKPFTPDVDVNTPKVDDVPNPDDIKFDFGSTNNDIPDTGSVPDIEVEEIIDDIDYDALIRAVEPEPEVISSTFSESIEKVANESRLFRSLSDAKKTEVIREIQADFVNAYNKSLSDETKKILGQFDDPQIVAKLEKMWNNIGTNPSAQAKFVKNALDKTGAKFRVNTLAFWENYFTGKVPSTGEYPGPKQFFYNYIKAVGISAGIEGIIMLKKLMVDQENIGWDNIPGDSDLEKLGSLLNPGKALIKTIFPGIGHIAVGFGLNSDLLVNEYRKPSTDEVRKLLGIKTTSAVRVAEIATQNTKYAGYSRTVFIDEINIGDYALRIKDKQLVVQKKGADIPANAVDANANAGGNAPAPTPNTTKTTMTKAEVEAVATNATNGYIKPLTFTPNEDNKAEYNVTDKDGDKFTAKLNNGVIVITPVL
jgi:hypothetical protein